MTDTLQEPTADQQLERLYNTGMVSSKSLQLDNDQLYALCLIKLNNAVVPADYPDLKAAIEAITGVQEINLVIDHHTRATVPTDKHLEAVVEINLRIEPDVP